MNEPKKNGRPFAVIPKTTTPPANEKYYTIAEAVRLLNLHRHTIQARLRAGTLDGKLIGRTWHIYIDELFDNSSYLYYFDAPDADIGEKYLSPSEVNKLANGIKAPLGEKQIISIAENYEATLYRSNADRSHEVMIYDPEEI